MQGPVHRCAEQAAKFADAVILVHDVVTHFDLVQFLERKRQLATARPVTLEVVLVESVKNLMVGKHAHLQVIVHKALMQRAQHGLKADVVATVFKNDLESLNLLGTVAQDVDGVAMRKKVAERPADEVKILVIDALGCAVKRQSGISDHIALSKGVVDAAMARQLGHELRLVNHMAHSAHVAFFGKDRAGRHALVTDGLDACLEPLHIAAHQHGGWAHIVEQRRAVGLITVLFVKDSHTFDLLL